MSPSSQRQTADFWKAAGEESGTFSLKAQLTQKSQKSVVICSLCCWKFIRTRLQNWVYAYSFLKLMILSSCCRFAPPPFLRRVIGHRHQGVNRNIFLKMWAGTLFPPDFYLPWQLQSFQSLIYRRLRYYPHFSWNCFSFWATARGNEKLKGNPPKKSTTRHIYFLTIPLQ